MREMAQSYYDQLAGLLKSVQATAGSGEKLDFFQALEALGELIRGRADAGCKLMFIGNGASAAIASHMSTDFWKSAGLKALAFNDASLLTCIGNDFGYDRVFEKPIQMFAMPGDVLFAISSSGRSVNILNGVHMARRKGCKVVTLSGFEKGNPLRRLGDFNFYVLAEEYGPVEIIHHSICHCLLDTIMKVKNG